MNEKTRKFILWIISIAFTMLVVVYQRDTGPTHPYDGSITIEGRKVDFKLLRSHAGRGAAPVAITLYDTLMNGILSFRRYKSNDKWTKVMMKHVGGKLVDSIPHQPPAVKVIYTVSLLKNEEAYALTEKPLILWFKGAVPLLVLIPHIIFMFMALLFGIRAGTEALSKGNGNDFYIGFTMVTLVLGGIILGPLVQKYAFGEFWTGWPIGHSLTENTTYFIFIFWLIAWFKIRKNQMHRVWVFIAVVVMLAVYSFPHSAMGSEIDYRKQSVENTK